MTSTLHLLTVSSLLLIRAWVPTPIADQDTRDALEGILKRAGCERPVVEMQTMNRNRDMQIEVRCSDAEYRKSTPRSQP